MADQTTEPTPQEVEAVLERMKNLEELLALIKGARAYAVTFRHGGVDVRVTPQFALVLAKLGEEPPAPQKVGDDGEPPPRRGYVDLLAEVGANVQRANAKHSQVASHRRR